MLDEKEEGESRDRKGNQTIKPMICPMIVTGELEIQKHKHHARGKRKASKSTANETSHCFIAVVNMSISFARF